MAHTELMHLFMHNFEHR